VVGSGDGLAGPVGLGLGEELTVGDGSDDSPGVGTGGWGAAGVGTGRIVHPQCGDRITGFVAAGAGEALR
jgi:hypothetical protein